MDPEGRIRTGIPVVDIADLYDGQALQPEKVGAREALRVRYGNRDESRVQDGPLRPLAAAA